MQLNETVLTKMFKELKIIKNSYLLENGEVLGYCSIAPKVGEDHMFGNMIVYFAYEDEGKLYFSKHKSVNEDDEAEFIQDYLIKCGSFSTIEDIKLVIEAQTEYLKSVGIIEDIENINNRGV